MGKVFLGIICLVLFFGFLGNISGGVHNLRVDEVTQTFAVTTGGGVTSGDVVLSRDLFKDEVGEVHAVTSTLAENPAVGTYTAATNTLAVTGLTESESRTLTVVYYSEKIDDIMQAIGPFMFFLIAGGILAAIGWVVWSGMKSKGRRG